MIRYALRCDKGGHSFDGWFRSIEDFDRQSDRHLVSCPVCGETSVAKELMRPAVASGQSSERPMPAATAAQAVVPTMTDDERFERLRSMARDVRARSDYVGPQFAEEARRIHYGEAETRPIFGEATLSQVKDLADEGIPALPLPPLPEDQN